MFGLHPSSPPRVVVGNNRRGHCPELRRPLLRADDLRRGTAFAVSMLRGLQINSPLPRLCLASTPARLHQELQSNAPCGALAPRGFESRPPGRALPRPPLSSTQTIEGLGSIASWGSAWTRSRRCKNMRVCVAVSSCGPSAPASHHHCGHFRAMAPSGRWGYYDQFANRMFRCNDFLSRLSSGCAAPCAQRGHAGLDGRRSCACAMRASDAGDVRVPWPPRLDQ